MGMPVTPGVTRIGDASDALALVAYIAGASASLASPSPLFPFHPFLSALGFTVFMHAAIRSYYAPYVMGMITMPEERAPRRRWHRFFNFLALLSVVLGGIAIVSHKASQGKSLLPHTIHGWAGIGVLTAFAVQAAVGLMKSSALDDGKPSGYKWHGPVGQVIHACGMALIPLGAALLVGVSGWQTVVSTVACVGSVGLLTLFLSEARSPSKGDKEEDASLVARAGGRDAAAQAAA